MYEPLKFADEKYDIDEVGNLYYFAVLAEVYSEIMNIGLKISNPLFLNRFYSSFTNSSNNDYLWTKYADNSMGISIGFDFSPVQMISSEPNFHTLYRQEIKYNELSELKKIIKDGLIEHELNKGLGTSNIDKLFFGINTYIYKKNYFLKEEEKRIIIFLNENDNCIKRDLDTNRRYYELDISKNIKSVTVGKLSKHTLADISMFLESYGFDRSTINILSQI